MSRILKFKKKRTKRKKEKKKGAKRPLQQLTDAPTKGIVVAIGGVDAAMAERAFADAFFYAAVETKRRIAIGFRIRGFENRAIVFIPPKPERR